MIANNKQICTCTKYFIYHFVGCVYLVKRQIKIWQIKEKIQIQIYMRLETDESFSRIRHVKYKCIQITYAML